MGQNKFIVGLSHDVTDVFNAEIKPLLDKVFELADQHNIPIFVGATLQRTIGQEDGGFSEQAESMLRTCCAGMLSHGLMITTGFAQMVTDHDVVVAKQQNMHSALDSAIYSSERVVKKTLDGEFYIETPVKH